MVENEWNGREFTSFEYKEIQVPEDKGFLYLDCYENFGWTVDDKFPPQRTGEKIQIKMKRNRKIVNKVELTRLQRNFEASMDEIDSLEASKTNAATALSIATGVIGTGIYGWLCICCNSRAPNYMAVRIDGDTGLSWLDSAIFRISENKEKESTEGSAIH